jgi:hypothetical protein
MTHPTPVVRLLHDSARQYAGLTGSVSVRLRLADAHGETLIDVPTGAPGTETSELDQALLDILQVTEEEEISLNREDLGTMVRRARFAHGQTLFLVLTYDRKLKKPNGREICGYLRHDARRKFKALRVRIAKLLDTGGDAIHKGTATGDRRAF